MFSRQAIQIVWDYSEASPWSNSAGGWTPAFRFVVKVLEYLEPKEPGVVHQQDASGLDFRDVVVSTDPPYYDYVPYSDLSDFFYVWIRRSLRGVYPQLLSTMLVPKSEELVANHERRGGKPAAKEFFESGFRSVFAKARKGVSADYPMTVYYAFKQSSSPDQLTSASGWESILQGMIQSRWMITATWPMRSELGNRARSISSNALASSIVLALRPRPDTALTNDRRGFIAALQAELPEALRNLQQGAIAPVDLPQAAIGPGMAVFSRYESVVEADGSQMTVSSALSRINEILDQVLNEQEGDFDPTTRFAIAWYRQHGYGIGRFGDADNLARARNTSMDILARDGILSSRAGNVTILGPGQLREDYDVGSDEHTSAWGALHYCVRILEAEGVRAAGDFLAAAVGRQDGAVDPGLVKELAFLLFAIAEKNGWTKDAIAFNTLASSWTEIVEASRTAPPRTSKQSAFDFEEVV